MNGEQIRVLIIDDEPFHAEAVAESLQRVGYECVIATSGAGGARKIEEEDFDVILTDLRMEDMDGLAILRKAKQSTPGAEVVVITGHGDPDRTKAAIGLAGTAMPAVSRVSRIAERAAGSRKLSK